LADLTFSRCFVQSVSSKSWNEVIPMALKRSIPFRKSTSVDLWLFQLEYLELQKPNWCKLNFFGFMTQSYINAPKFSQSRCHMREIWFFKDDIWILPANRFHEETSPNYILKHLNRYLSFYFSNLAPLSQSLKISCKAISPFLGK